jgi:hypothetical protein
LAVDALNDLDGADAVTGLWTGTSVLSLFLASLPPLSYFTSPLSFLTFHPNQSLRNVRNPSKMAHASNISLGDSGIVNLRLAEITNLPHLLHI